MKKMVRLIHSGDIHLDCPFSGLDPVTAEVRRNELRASFTSLIHYAKCEKVDLLLLPGDVFDSNFVTRETLTLLVREFSSLNCPVVISPGNHDCVSSVSVWRDGVFPDNVHIFTSDELSYFDFPEIGVRVWGWAFVTNTMDISPVVGKTVGDSPYINILSAHGDLVNAASGDCPLSVRELEAFGADYTALGHIHNPKAYTDRIAYSGCLTGRSFDETGHKGALDVTIDGDKITTKKVKFSKRRYECAELDVSGASSNFEIKEKIGEFVTKSHYGDDVILRLTLKGNVDPALIVDTRVLEESPKRVFAIKILDETSPLLDSESLKADPTLRGELYRVLEPMLLSDDREERLRAADALRIGLAAIAGEAVV